MAVDVHHHSSGCSIVREVTPPIDVRANNKAWIVHSSSAATTTTTPVSQQKIETASVNSSGVAVASSSRIVPAAATHPSLSKSRLRSAWRNALSVVRDALVVATYCATCAWGVIAILSAGNYYTGRLPAYQSNLEFYTATTLHIHTSFYLITLAAHAVYLVHSIQERRQHTARGQQQQQQQLSLRRCLVQLLQHTSAVFTASLLLVIATSYVVQTTSSQRLRSLHVGFYVLCFWMHLFTTSATIGTFAIMRRSLSASQPAHQPTTMQRLQATRWKSIRTFWKVYALTSPKIGAVVASTLFVQLVSLVDVPRSSNGTSNGSSSATTTAMLLLLSFSAGSVALKFVLKELVKWSIVRFDVHDVRTIFASVGLPATLINTQMRVMLQRVDSAQHTLRWSLVMAAIELSVRVAKVVWTQRVIRLREAAAPLCEHQGIRQSTSRLLSAVVTPTTHHSKQTAATTPLPTLTMQPLVRWKHQIVAFQVADVFAGMAAEYIAIGSAAAFCFFYGRHPKYGLHVETTPVAKASSATPSSFASSYFQSIAVQVAIELVVDFVGCAFEIYHGVDFARHIRPHRRFVGLSLGCVTVLNVFILSMIYMTP